MNLIFYHFTKRLIQSVYLSKQLNITYNHKHQTDTLKYLQSLTIT